MGRSGALEEADWALVPRFAGPTRGVPRPRFRGHSDKAAVTGVGAAPPSRSQGPRPGGAGTALALPRVLCTREAARRPQPGD